MNKRELVDAVSTGADLDNKTAGAAVDAVIAAITAELGKGEKVSISGFGTFEIRTRSARSGRHPQTGEPMEIKASTSAAFKPATALKQALPEAS